jgi:hypothetical protein
MAEGDHLEAEGCFEGESGHVGHESITMQYFDEVDLSLDDRETDLWCSSDSDGGHGGDENYTNSDDDEFLEMQAMYS